MTKINNFQMKIVNRALDQDHRIDIYERNFCRDIQKKGNQATVTDKQNSMINKIGGKLR